MTTILYPAIATPFPAGGYEARFPDLVGVTAHGSTMGDLLADARARLSDALKKLEGEGDSWPEASSLEAARSGAGEGVVLLIDIEVDDPPTRVNISIGERLLKRIDTAAQAGGMTRSGFLAHAARRSLGEGDRPFAKSNIDLEAATKRMQEELSALGRKLNESLGPDSAFTKGVADLDQRVFERIQKAADSVSAAMEKRKAQTREPTF